MLLSILFLSVWLDPFWRLTASKCKCSPRILSLSLLIWLYILPWVLLHFHDFDSPCSVEALGTHSNSPLQFKFLNSVPMHLARALNFVPALPSQMLFSSQLSHFSSWDPILSLTRIGILESTWPLISVPLAFLCRPFPSLSMPTVTALAPALTTFPVGSYRHL